VRNHGRTTGTNGDGFRRLEVITGVGRRRRWSTEEKARIVAESLDPATTASAVARRHGLHASQLFVWRQQLQQGALAAETSGAPGFVPVLLAVDSPAPVTCKRWGSSQKRPFSRVTKVAVRQ
jgi:transposase